MPPLDEWMEAILKSRVLLIQRVCSLRLIVLGMKKTCVVTAINENMSGTPHERTFLAFETTLETPALKMGRSLKGQQE